MTIDVSVTNYGAVTAKGVIVWAGFDAGNDKAWGASESASFHLGYDETREITLHIEAPKGVHTRVLVWVWGDNFNILKSESDWFST